MGIIPIQKLSGALASIRQTLAKLKTQIRGENFPNPESEIEFFKKDKPHFVSEQLYAIDLCIIQTSRPCYDTALIHAFLEAELRVIKDYFHKYSFLYQYYQLDSTDMDSLFFLRGAYPKDALVPPDAADLDPEFSTACDHAWARFLAYERLQEWLLGELRALDRSKAGPQAPASVAGEQLTLAPGALKWTGETINLVEIAYGIWLTGQVNNGNVSITEIMEYLEVVFRVRVGKPHRRWQSLTRRKRLAVFRYVDEMKVALVKRMEEELEM